MADAAVAAPPRAGRHQPPHAPIAVREQLAAHDSRPRAGRGGDRRRGGGRGGGAFHLQPLRALHGRRRPEAMREAAVRRLVELSGRDRAQLEPLLYVRKGGDAAEHLFAVAGGLDSLVPGEAQILAQIRDAYARALELGATGPVSNRLFHEALEAGKRVRNETAIGRSTRRWPPSPPRSARAAGRPRGRPRADRRGGQGGRAGRGRTWPRAVRGRSRSPTATPTARRRWPRGSTAPRRPGPPGGGG